MQENNEHGQMNNHNHMGCGCPGCWNMKRMFSGYNIARFIIGVLLILLVFGFGFKLGQITSEFRYSDGFGWGGRHTMMYRNQDDGNVFYKTNGMMRFNPDAPVRVDGQNEQPGQQAPETKPLPPIK